MLFLVLIVNVLVCSCKAGDFFDYPDYDDDFDEPIVIIQRGPHDHRFNSGPQQHFPSQGHHHQSPRVSQHIPQRLPPAPQQFRKVAHAPPPPKRIIHNRPPPPRFVQREEIDSDSLLVPVRSYHSSAGVSQFDDRESNGRVRFGFAHPGQVKSEFRDKKGNTHGYFSYSQPSRDPTVVLYKSGPGGYHASSNQIPVGPQETPEVKAARETHIRLYNEVVRQRGLHPTALQGGRYRNIK